MLASSATIGVQRFVPVMFEVLLGGVLFGVPEPPEGTDPIHLRWVAPEGCPGPTVVRARVDELLGDERIGGVVMLDAEVRRASTGFRLSLRIETAAGSTAHELDAPVCDPLADATALVVAIAVDPLRVATAVERAEATVARQLAEGRSDGQPSADEPAIGGVRPAEDAPRSVAISDDRDPKLGLSRSGAGSVGAMRARVGLRFMPMVEFGALPRVSFGGMSALPVFGEHWRAELLGAYFLAQETELDINPAVSGEIAWWWLGARGCGVPRLRTIEFPLCAAFEGGVLRGRGTGATVAPRVERRPWLALTASVGLGWAPWRPIAFFVEAAGAVPLVHSGFVVGDRELHQVRPVGVRGLLGIEVRTP